MKPSDLPVAVHKTDIQNAVAANRVIIVMGETGSGKTTQLPQFLLESFQKAEADAQQTKNDTNSGGGTKLVRIGITQPRRVATVTVARRVAEEQDCPLGGRVGYCIRFEDCTSRETQIKYMTDGILVRECMEDPLLQNYSVIMLDEAHERSLETDVLFGLLKLALGKRQDLKLVVMSATLDANKFSHYFFDCPIFVIPGRIYEVDIFYNTQMNPKDHRNTYIQDAFETVMHIHCNDIPGDILVFMTGRGDIDDICKRLEKANRALDYRNVRFADVEDMVVMPLYGALESDSQRAIFDPAPRGCRKVIVATNIAATSVTIDGVKYVVDSGFVKQKEYDPATAMDALLIVPISRAAAVQRTGRAGRTANGKCYRLYSKEYMMEQMAEETTPEIVRTSLTSTVLSLKRLGVADVLNFDFMEPPEKQRIIDALKQLFYLDALDENGVVTAVGEGMSNFPLAPNLARVLLASIEEGCSEEMCTIAALLSVEDIFIKPRFKDGIENASKEHAKFFDETGDHWTLVNLFEAFRDNGQSADWARQKYLHVRALKTAVNIRKQIIEIINSKMNLSLTTCWDKSKSRYQKQKVLKALTTGYYLNCARKHSTHNVFYPAGLGRDSHLGLHPHPSSAFFESNQIDFIEWVVFQEVVYTSKAFMRCMSTVNGNWLKELLPKLDRVNIAKLSQSEQTEDVDKIADDAITTLVDTEAVANLKRSREEAISDARKRYLQRKGKV